MAQGFGTSFPTRRTVIVGLAGALAAACGGDAAPPPKPEPTKAPAAASAPAPTAAAAAAPTKAPEPTKAPSAPVKVNIWFTANWNEVTDKTVGAIYDEWGKANNAQVEWQSIPASPQYLAKQSAAVAAGEPPEIDNGNNIYWYAQGERADLTALTTKFKDQAGGVYPIATASNTATDGRVFAAPYAVDCWPMHWRKDIIGPVTGNKYFENWDQVIELGAKAQQPPKTYLIAFSTGHEGDHVNNIATVLWAYGGRLADEKGVPDIKNPANKAGLELIAKLWKNKLIPPDSQGATVTSWNNETYQKQRALMAINPATIYGWLAVNDKETAANTGLAIPPKGTAGQFAEGAGVAFGVFKKAKGAEKALAALEYFLGPDRLQKVSSAVEGRYVPVYRDHTKTEFWQKSAFADMRTIADVGRNREYPAPPQPWLADVTDARFTLSDMLQKIFNGEAIEKAQEWAQADMMESYGKFVKR
jgi:ABC-type glycerol-3-phosphate transport system substrate-binding protein